MLCVQVLRAGYPRPMHQHKDMYICKECAKPWHHECAESVCPRLDLGVFLFVPTLFKCVTMCMWPGSKMCFAHHTSSSRAPLYLREDVQSYVRAHTQKLVINTKTGYVNLYAHTSEYVSHVFLIMSLGCAPPYHSLACVA